MSEQVEGPASYFPAIETQHGQPVGHGHANALVAHARSRTKKG